MMQSAFFAQSLDPMGANETFADSVPVTGEEASDIVMTMGEVRERGVSWHGEDPLGADIRQDAEWLLLRLPTRESDEDDRSSTVEVLVRRNFARRRHNVADLDKILDEFLDHAGRSMASDVRSGFPNLVGAAARSRWSLLLAARVAAARVIDIVAETFGLASLAKLANRLKGR